MLKPLYITRAQLSHTALLHLLRDCSKVRIGESAEFNAKTQRTRRADTNRHTSGIRVHLW